MDFKLLEIPIFDSLLFLGSNQMLRIYTKKIAWISLQSRIVSKNIQFYSSSQHENSKIEHPWLKLCTTQNVLPDYQRIITFMVGNTTSGNLNALSE